MMSRAGKRHGHGLPGRPQTLEVRAAGDRDLSPMPDLSGKHGLIVGVANKRSISWAIAQAAAAAGARLALTYQGERLEENVRDLSETLESPIVMPLDVTNDQQIADVAAAHRSRVRRPGFSGARRGVRAEGRAGQPVRADVARGLSHRARRERVLADRADARGRCR